MGTLANQSLAHTNRFSGSLIPRQAVSGRSLELLLAERGRFEAGEVIDILRQVAKGLGAAHAAGIVHRDMKPANLVLDEEGHLKLVDFGIARIEEGKSAITRPQSLIGTPLYMAPEILRGKPADGRADLYGLALTVVPDAIWTPFAAKFNAPNIGWGGVFLIAAVFDVCAAAMAFFILRRMRVPVGGEAPAVEGEPSVARRTVAAGAAD